MGLLFPADSLPSIQRSGEYWIVKNRKSEKGSGQILPYVEVKENSTKPIILVLWQWCRTHPSGLVKASAGFKVPGMWESSTSLAATHYCRAKG